MEKTIRHSKKREAILKLLQSSKEHPGAEWIYLKLKPEFPDLSLGTVYRNIAQFIKSGDIIRIATVNGQERYDADTIGHAHFICAQCGDIKDVGVALDISLIREAEAATGAYISSVSLSFDGLCLKCSQIKKTKEE